MEFGILGPVEARDGDRIADLGTPKQRALLALLLLHGGRAVTADRLADLLWDGAPPARAEVSLRSYAANLRRVLPPDALVHDHGGYRLDLGADGSLDAQRFEAAVARAREAPDAAELDAALALWRGPALADVATSSFARAEAARLEDLRLEALELRFGLAVADDPAAAVPELERAVAAHPLREGLRALLLRALHGAGRTAEALGAYRDLRERLADELGLDPSPALRELEEAIRTGTLTSEAAPPAAAAGGPSLLGRDREVAGLRSALAEAAAGRGRVVLLRGDPGIGKTRLLEELHALAVTDGAVTASVACPATGDAPAFWPWAQVVAAVAAEVDVAALADARTADALHLAGLDTGAAAPGLAPDAARFQRYDAVTTFLVRAASERPGRPVVVLLDDLQWADPASLHLLAFLAGAGALAAAPVLVVATVRSGGAPPAGDLRDVLAALTRAHAVERIELGGLPDDAVATLAAAHDVPADVVPAVVARAGGNPFFVHELARLDPGLLRADAVPAAVRDVVRQRVARLGDATAKVLGAAAVIGREVDPDVLAAVEGEAALDALDEAVDAHLLEEDRATGRYRFVHALVQEVLAEGSSGLRRARLHARIAHALDAGPSLDPGRLAEVARHACAGLPADPGLATRAAEASLDAAAAASAALGFESAATLCSRALDALADAPSAPAPALRARLLIALAGARRSAGDPAASRDACLAAAEAAREAGDPELLASAALGLALPGAVIGMDFGLLDQVRIDLLDAALAELPADDSALRVRVLAHLALALYLSDERKRRDDAAEEAVAMADRLGAPGLRAAALAAKRSTLWGPKPLGERTLVARDLIRLAEEGGATLTALEGHIALAIDLLEAGQLEEFATEVRHVERRAAEVGQPFYAWYVRVLEATTASLQGRYRDAEAAAAAAREVGGVALGRRAQWGQVGWQFVHAWDLGALGELEPPLRALASAFPGNANVTTALALLLADRGHTDEAAEVAADLLEDPTRVPEDATWLFSLTLLGEAAAALGDQAACARVAELLAPASDRLVLAGSAVACCGSSDRVRGLALTTAGRLDEAAGAFASALVGNRAVGALPWVARTQVGLALLHRRRGDEAAASALLDEAGATAERLGAPGLRAAVERAR